MIDGDDDGEGAAIVSIDGRDYPRVRLGEEREPEESPCPGCGAYYGALHEWGCDIEECPRCGGQRIRCGCTDAPRAG